MPPGTPGRAAWVPPHPRGSAPAPPLRDDVDEGSPAPAGIGLYSWFSDPDTGRFPRTRGDRPSASIRRRRGRGVPPHPRGSALARGEGGRHPHGSPAPAGIGPLALRVDSSQERFPRTRGDRPYPLGVDAAGAVVPPYPRGSAPYPRRPRLRRSGSPAPAGIGPFSTPDSRPRRRFPRTRGDRPSRLRPY